MNKKRTPPALTPHDERRIKELLIPIQRELAAINRRLARLETRRPSVLIAGKEGKISGRI